MKDSPNNKVFGESIIDEKLVRKLCFGGVCSDYRCVAWRIIFQVVGLRRKSHANEIETRQRKYMGMAAKMGCSWPTDKDKYSVNEIIDKDCLTRPNGTYHYGNIGLHEKIAHQIDLDIKRIDPRYKTYADVDISYMYYHILWLIAQRRPQLGYVQGMADILVPFVLVFSHENIEKAESSAYFCYSRLLDEMQHNIIELQAGMIKGMDLILQTVDPDFHKFLKDIGLEIHMFAFRWFNCFFTREFKMPVLLKVLDTIFASDNISESLLYFGVALLMRLKPVLIENNFSYNILFLQSIYEREWEEAEIELVLSSAKFYRKVTSRQLIWSRFWD
ncbi:GTPase activating protein [Encephalitozoon hellem]|nr:GTPase activating protein [Encephalitozoon hellem]